MMTSNRRYRFLLFTLIFILTGSVFAGWCPETDLDEDCQVGLNDIVILTHQWLNIDSCEETDNCADFDNSNNINFADFSFLAEQWAENGNYLFINEFMASNNSDSGINDPYGDYDDWIEIYNSGDMPVDLAGMYLTDTLTNPTKWQIPSGSPSQTTIPAHGFVIIWADEEAAEGPLHASFKLSGSGEDLGLFYTDGVTAIDTVVFGEQTTNMAYGRDPCIIDNWRFFPVPTPAADNNGAYLGEIEKVEFSKERGFYTSSFNLTLACTTSGANIYYTTDGRSPVIGEANTPTSKLYATQIPVTGSKYIRAAALKTGWKPTKTETHTYIFDANGPFNIPIKTMPILAIVGDPTESLWLPNGVMSNPYGRTMLWERPISLEVINGPAGSDYQIDCGIRVHGNFRDYTIGNDWYTCYPDNVWWPQLNPNKFAFRFYFRNDYGDNRFDYPLFPYAPEGEKSQCIVLRAGKNDTCSPFIKDEWAKRLFRAMGGVQLTGSFVNLYINGVYKAYFNPCPRDNSQFFEDWYGTDNKFDVITVAGVRDGDSVAWDAFLNYINTNDLSIPANYEYASSKLDIVQFIDQIIVRTHIADFDWPNNNWAAHRERTDNGIFRFSIWDAEGVAETWVIDAGGIDVNAFTDMPWYGSAGGGLNAGDWPIARIYRALKANPNFRQLFADRVHKHYRNNGIMTTSNLLAKWWEAWNEVNDVLDETVKFPTRFVPENFLPLREPYMIKAYHDNGLFNMNIEAPVFYVNNVYKYGGYISASDAITMTDPCNAGQIYYTTDGSDPKVSGILYTGTEGSQTTTVRVADNAAKKVRIPAGDIGTTWRGGSEPYNETGWTSGTGGVGYDRQTTYDTFIGIDVETAMYNIRGTCYIRIPFNVDAGDIGHITVLTLKMRYDDGFVAYINGTEVYRVNAPTTLAWNSLASTSSAEATSAWNSYDISSYISSLHSGTNILAIHGLNTPIGGSSSGDFLISTILESTQVFPPSGSITLSNSANLKARVYKSSTSEWSALNEAVYTLANVGQSLRITEIMYHPKDTGGPNDANTEYIELKNVGGSAINLNLARLTKGVDFTFGPTALAAGQHILVVKDINAFKAKYGTGYNIAGEYSGSLDNSGEKIRLKDANGTNILDFDYKDGWRSIVDGDGYSLTIINPADSNVNHWGNKDYWRSSAYINGSPGWDDSGIIPNPGAIVINEVLAHAHAEAPDWIELKNTTSGAINIGNWFLSDSDTNVMKYRFAAGTSIPANGYIVVYENTNFGPNSVDPGKLFGFALSENGDTVCLSSALDANSKLTGYREKEDFGASETGISLGRYYKASTGSYNFVPMNTITPNTANSYPKVGPVVFTEIMYNPDWPATGSYANDEYEFIELRNTSGTAVTLYDSNENLPWKFTNGIDFTFPDNVTIAAGARILVVKNPTAFNVRYPGLSGITYGPYSGWLANDGEQLELSKPGDVDGLGVRQYIRVERVDYSDGSHPNGEPGDIDLWPTGADGLGKSLKRTTDSAYGNDPNNWTAATPAPGS